ncbi:MAG: tetratricopeptide repeat protein [Acidobacteriota bacterium]
MDTPAEVTRENGPPAGLPSKKRLWLAALALALVTFALFSPLLSAHFINYDDQGYVTDNPHVLGGLTWSGIRWAWSHFYFGSYYPLTLMSHMLDCDLYGLWAGGHHLTNLLFHIGSTLLLFAFLWKTTRAFWRSLVVALLFAIHPLHMESVAWISERKDVLSTFFLMAMLVAYADYARAPSVRRYLAVFGAFLLGLLSKSMIVTAPFLLLLLDYWPLRRFSLGGSGEEEPAEQGIPSAPPRLDLRLGRKLVAEKLPLFGLSVLFSLLTLMAQSHAGAIGGFPMRLKIINAFSSYGAYLSKTLIPANLALFYPMRLGLFRPAEAFLAAVLMVLVLWLGWRWRARAPYLFVGWLWYLGMLVPVIGIVEIGSMAMADRYTYVPLVGLFVILAWGAADVLRTERGRKLRPLVLAAAGAWLVLLGGLTVRQATLWHDSLTIWGHTLAVTKLNAVAHTCYGEALTDAGHFRLAEEHLKRAITLWPNHSPAWTGLAVAAAQLGDLDLAERCLRQELTIVPDDFRSQVVLARLLMRSGKFDEAKKQWTEVLKSQPGYPEALSALEWIRKSPGAGRQATAGRPPAPPSPPKPGEDKGQRR